MLRTSRSLRGVNSLYCQSWECVQRIRQFSINPTVHADDASREGASGSSTRLAANSRVPDALKTYFQDVSQQSSSQLPEFLQDEGRPGKRRRRGPKPLNYRILPATAKISRTFAKHIPGEERLGPLKAQSSTDYEKESSAQSHLDTMIGLFQRTLEKIQSNSQRADGDPTSHQTDASQLPSENDWIKMFYSCLETDNIQAAKKILDLMRRAGFSPALEHHDAILNWFALRGLVSEADAHVAGIPLEGLRPRQRDMLVKARVNAGHPNKARKLLYSFEEANAFAPMWTYSRVIHALLHAYPKGSEQNARHAWDVFKRMREKTNHKADSWTYNTLIQGIPWHSRILELYKEMIAEGVIPADHSYDMVISQLARRRLFAPYALQVAQDMLRAHIDYPDLVPEPIRPSQFATSELMRAARLITDLRSALWVFNLVAQSPKNEKDGGKQSTFVSAEILSRLFHTFCDYRPGSTVNPEPVVLENKHKETVLKSLHSQESKAIELPKTGAEVISEVTEIWERFVGGSKGSNVSKSTSSQVVLGPDLLNSYLRVFYAHAPPSQSYHVYRTLFDSLGIPPNVYSYLGALEAYSRAKPASLEESSIIFPTVRKVWENWLGVEASTPSILYDHPQRKDHNRLVARAWSAMIRHYTFAGDFGGAEALLRQFAERYPPKALRNALKDSKPLVEVPEDCIVPSFTFSDVALLHYSALATQQSGIAEYVMWLVNAYGTSPTLNTVGDE